MQILQGAEKSILLIAVNLNITATIILELQFINYKEAAYSSKLEKFCSHLEKQTDMKFHMVHSPLKFLPRVGMKGNQSLKEQNPLKTGTTKAIPSLQSHNLEDEVLFTKITSSAMSRSIQTKFSHSTCGLQLCTQVDGFFRSLEILSWYCYCHSMASSPAPYPNSKPSTWSPSLICLISAACASVLLFTYCRIVKQICYRHHGASLYRNWVGRQLPDEANPDDPSLQFHSRGVDSSIVYSLPISQFKKSDGRSHSNTDCAVCLGEFEEGELLKHLPNCSHAFHIPCIDTWFESHSNCPLCRSHVYDLTMDHEFSGSMYTLLETLRREDFFQERAEHYQILRAEILQTSTNRQDPENGN